MEKNDLLRVRVTPKLREDFEAICNTTGMTPPDVLRGIVERYVQENLSRLGDRIAVNISRPEGYDFGAYRIYIKLRRPDESLYMGSPIPFPFPSWPKRRIASDKEYQAVVGIPDKNDFVHYDLGGVFLNGEWRGHLYTNGIAENENPTSIDEVKRDLEDALAKHFDRFKA